jgi:hypothetical protein
MTLHPGAASQAHLKERCVALFCIEASPFIPMQPPGMQNYFGGRAGPKPMLAQRLEKVQNDNDRPIFPNSQRHIRHRPRFRERVEVGPGA